MSAEELQLKQSKQALLYSTLAFVVCFAVWTIFSIIGVKIKQDFNLSDTQFGILVATPILTGSLSRLFLGIWADQYGGRRVFTIQMLATAVAAYLLTLVTTFPMMIVAALGVGLAGGSFAVGVTYVSSWFPANRQGTALGIFGMGNVGAAITNFGAPFLLIAMGGEWQGVARVYAIILVITAILFYAFSKDDPNHTNGVEKQSFVKQLEPLKHLQVWRFAVYYFFVFGAFVALALWLPRYYVGVYGLELTTAGMLAAAYALPGSIFRAFGGWLSDSIGARRVMYWTFISCFICTFILSYPSTDYVIKGINGPIAFNATIPLELFVLVTVALGFFMSLGKAAVFKHIPVYYPNNVGSVGGIVGLIGGLGGFFLPIAFGMMNDFTGVWTSCFMLLTLIIGIAAIWMHVSIVRMDRRENPEMNQNRHFPEMEALHGQRATPDAE